MTSPFYDVVHSLALNITNASANEDEQLAAEAYVSLKELCEKNDGGDLDHPLQWEALGDFSENHEEALKAYQKGLLCSKKLGLVDYSASIKFAIAEIYLEKDDLAQAINLASEASIEADNSNDNELKIAINDFLNEVRPH